MRELPEAILGLRAVLVAAHPDDEVLGAGSQLARFDDLTIVHVTDGAPRNMRDALAYGFSTWQDYAAARRRELHSALQIAGIPAWRARLLGVADQQAAFEMAEIARRLAVLFRELQPEVILTHAYEGGHPDHDATALGVHAASRATPVVEFASYHAGPNGIEVFEFLPAEGRESFTHVLEEAERDLKRRMLDCFPSQRETLRLFPVELERYRWAPRYDFTRPPHSGRLYYENFDWGITGESWRSLAAEALGSLLLGAAG